MKNNSYWNYEKCLNFWMIWNRKMEERNVDIRLLPKYKRFPKIINLLLWWILLMFQNYFLIVKGKMSFKHVTQSNDLLRLAICCHIIITQTHRRPLVSKISSDAPKLNPKYYNLYYVIKYYTFNILINNFIFSYYIFF